jgi:hypothetical protein
LAAVAQLALISRLGVAKLAGYVLDARLAMWVVFLLLFLLLALPLSVHAEDLGELSANPAGQSGSSGSFSFFGLFGSFGIPIS